MRPSMPPIMRVGKGVKENRPRYRRHHGRQRTRHGYYRKNVAMFWLFHLGVVFRSSFPPFTAAFVGGTSESYYSYDFPSGPAIPFTVVPVWSTIY